MWSTGLLFKKSRFYFCLLNIIFWRKINWQNQHDASVFTSIRNLKEKKLLVLLQRLNKKQFLNHLLTNEDNVVLLNPLTWFYIQILNSWFFKITDYQYGVRLVSGVNNKVLITLNARNDHDRQKFVEDLREAILEVILSCLIAALCVIII